MAQFQPGQSGNPDGRPPGIKETAPRRVKGYEDSPELSFLRRTLNKDPEPPKTGPTLTAGVTETKVPPRPEPVMDTLLDPEPGERVESAQAEAAEWEDPSTLIKQDETLRDILDAARKNRRGYTGDDPTLKPIPFSRVFNTLFAEWFGRKEADGSVTPRMIIGDDGKWRVNPAFLAGEDSWYKWLVLGKAIFGEPMTPAEKKIFQEFTGRKTPPTKRLREVWVALARRSGKNHFFAAVVVYVALFLRHGIRRGNIAKIMLLALDREQSGESFRLIADLILSIPALAAMIVGGSTDRTMSVIKLANRIDIQVMVANQGSVRSRAAIFILLDEIGHWQTKEGAVKLDADIVAAIRPTRWGMTNSLLVAITSPRARKGVLYQMSKQWGQETVTRRDGSTLPNPILYWQARTDASHVERVLTNGLDMRPTKDPDFLMQLESDFLADPAAFVSEGLGQFRADLESFVSIEAVEAVMVKGQTTIPYEPNYHYVMFIDPSGGNGQDSAAVCVARSKPMMNLTSGRDYNHVEVCLVEEYRPKFNAVNVVRRIVEIANEYKISKIVGDGFSGGTWASIIKDSASDLYYTLCEDNKSVLYRKFLPLLTGGRVSLPDKETAIGKRILDQLVSLEITGEGKVDAAGKAPEDTANVVAGASVLAATTSPAWAEVTSVTRAFGRLV